MSKILDDKTATVSGSSSFSLYPALMEVESKNRPSS